MKVTATFELRPEQALEMLCKTLYMDFAFTDDDSFYIKENPRTGELAVWCDDRVYDDRAELFVAIRNLMVCIIPNLSFRNDDYIFDLSKTYKDYERQMKKVSKMIDDFNALGEKYLVPVASMYPTSAISVAGSFDSKYGCDHCRYKEKCIKEHRLLEIDYSYDIAQQTGPHPRYVLNPTCTCPLEEIDED